ncbi:MAG: hypothetical protein WKF94_02045 [Solirubrobacteraceae bacterium]
MSSPTAVMRVPAEMHEQVSRVSDLVKQTPGDLLAAAWTEYVERHRDDFAQDLERAAELLRNGTLEDLVDFAQEAHQAVVSVDVDAVISAWEDPEVQAVLETARSSVDRSRRAGRRLEL